MSFPADPFRHARILVIACSSLLVSASGGAPPELPSPTELQEEVPDGPRLGGEFSVSPALVPHVLLSPDDPPDTEPDVHDEEPEIRVEDEPQPSSPPSESVAETEPALRTAQIEPRLNSLRESVEERTRPRLVPLSRAEMESRGRVRNALRAYSTWRLNSRDHSPWEIMHAIIANGTATRLLQDGPGGKPVTAVGWLCFNRGTGPLNQRLFYLTRDGFETRPGAGVEGHRGQFLAVLAQARVTPDYPIEIDRRSFTIADLIEYEKKTCYPKTELTFKLIALNYYLDQDAQWESDQGHRWDIPRLIREEMAQPIRGATCGGTHRLAGLSLAVRKRIASGRPLDGEYARAAHYLNQYHAYTFRLQNRDGSFSTKWFERREDEPDPDRRLQTTGHILEWLCYSIPAEQLRDRRIRAAADFLARLMLLHRTHEWENGPLGHAVHALALYDELVFQPHDRHPGHLHAVVGEKEEPDVSR